MGGKQVAKLKGVLKLIPTLMGDMEEVTADVEGNCKSPRITSGAWRWTAIHCCNLTRKLKQMRTCFFWISNKMCS
jgi:hypothetical protein